MLTKIKQKFERIIEPVGNIFLKLRLDPNIITLLGFLLSLVAIVSLAITGSLPVFLVVFIFASFMDSIDGFVARKTNRVTSFGAFLDSTLDRVTDALMALPLYIVSLLNFYEVFLLVLGEFLVSYTRARGETLGIKMSGIGIAERAERIILKFVIYALLAFSYSQTAYIFFWILLILTYVTVIQRVIHVYRSLGKP
mgnify:CR=1 FL=1